MPNIKEKPYEDMQDFKISTEGIEKLLMNINTSKYKPYGKIHFFLNKIWKIAKSLRDNSSHTPSWFNM